MTTQRQELAMEMRAQGMTFTSIAIQLGVTKQRAHQLVNEGKLAREKSVEVNKEEEALRALRAMNLTTPQIAARLNMRPRTISEKLKRMGISHPKGRPRKNVIPAGD